MPPNTMTLKDLESFLSSRRSAPREGGGLSKAASALRRAEDERQAQRSVFNQPREPEWQPDHVRPGGHALEAPMISPDDLFGTGIPTKIAMALKGSAPLVGGLGVIKNKGGNWLSGSVEGALSGLKRATSTDQLNPEMRAIYEQYADPVALTATPARNATLNNWVDKQLTRYVKNDMATPEDPIRALAERGVLHYSPPEYQTVHPRVELDRLSGGFPVRGVAQSVPAKSWENITDSIPKQASYLDHLPTHSIGNGSVKTALENQFGKFAAENPETLAYAFNRGKSMEDLGFNHLIDELSNSLNAYGQEQELAKWLKNAKTPAEEAIARRGNPVDLPRHLQLDPKSLERVSVPQAVERVSQINAWRAAQKAEADAAKANNAATHLFKEYPDKGFKWVELKQPEKVDPSAFAGDPRIKASLGDTVEGRGPRLALQDALKYEGDTMGHCVGGYCDDVASGRSKIYSLRDAKGQPHVTVEVNPGEGFAGKRTREEYEAFLRGHETPHSEEEIAQALLDLDKGGAWLPKIQQIKGKQNRAPNEEYLPFVQDFVKSGKWSDVGDLQNTGLQRAGWAPDVLERMKAAGVEAPEYGTADEINAALNALNKARGFAQGGSVANIAPYGPRHGSLGAKGKGYFGELQGKHGGSTEITTEDETGEYPLMVPTLSAEELTQLLVGGRPSESVYNKAREHADKLRARGESPFANPIGLKYPDPRFSQGGPVNKNPLSVQQLQAIIAQINQDHINAA